MRSCHRVYLDRFLANVRHHMRGRVIDIGGTRVNRKGDFTPPSGADLEWRYLNIDPATRPDCLCSADLLPIRDASADCILICETLEHLRSPHLALREAARIMAPGGAIVVTMPFLYALHGDPEDYERWTSGRFREALEGAGFTVERLEPLGGPFGVVHDTLLNMTWRGGAARWLKLLAFVLTRTVGLTLALDRAVPLSWTHITSGWGAVGRIGRQP